MNDFKSSVTILDQNRRYWTGRASGYSKVNQEELSSSRQHCVWQDTLCDEMRAHFPDRPPESIHVLDIGCGPGFFSIVLAEEGYLVTAADLTPAMLERARENAGELASRITFLEMNAEDLRFPDGCFDAIVTRNLTWNLPHPERAYQEWSRVLKSGGLLLNFDANWYHYLFNETARRSYEEDRMRTEATGIRDENIGDGFEVMEQIAAQIPLSRIQRPQWDRQILTSLDMQVTVNEQIWNRVWSPEEQINFSSTPLFLICAKKT